MKVKKTAKKIIDAVMLLMLPILAAEIQLGQESHEWLGIGMFCLFILHHVMNYKWFQGVFKGAYSPVRVFVTALNFLLLLDFLLLAYSGPKMSGFALQGLPLPGSMQTARILHLFASEWSFVLISLHTGVHSGLHGGVKQSRKLPGKTSNHVIAKETGNSDTVSGKKMPVWIARGILCAVSVFGVYAFFDLKMPDYLFMQTHFIFFDESKGLALFFAEVICMMVFFGVIGHWATYLLKKFKVKN